MPLVWAHGDDGFHRVPWIWAHGERFFEISRRQTASLSCVCRVPWMWAQGDRPFAVCRRSGHKANVRALDLAARRPTCPFTLTFPSLSPTVSALLRARTPPPPAIHHHLHAQARRRRCRPRLRRTLPRPPIHHHLLHARPPRPPRAPTTSPTT